MDFDDLAPLEMDETYEAEHKQQRESAEEEREGEGEVVVVVLGEEAERPLSASRPPPLPDSLSYSVVDETAKSTISHSDSSETFSHNNNNNNVNSSSSSSTIDKQPPPSSAVVQLEEAHSVDGNLPASSATTQEQQPQHQQEIDTTTTTTDNTTTTTAPPPPPPTHLPFTLFHQREVASHHNSKSHLHSHSQLLVASKQWAESVNSRFHSLKQETIQLQTNNKERMGMPTNRRAHFNKPVFQSLPGTGCPGVKHKMRVSKEFYL